MCFVFCDRKIIYTNSLLYNTECFVSIVFRIIFGKHVWWEFRSNNTYLKSNIYIYTNMKVSGLLYRHDVLRASARIQASRSCSALFSWKLQIRFLNFDLYLCGGGSGSKISIKVICNVAIVTKAKNYIEHNVISSPWDIKVYVPCRIIMYTPK